MKESDIHSALAGVEPNLDGWIVATRTVSTQSLLAMYGTVRTCYCTV